VDPTPDPRPASSTPGGYRLLEQVATGGSSVVWSAETPDGRIVAFKLLDASASGAPADRRRFFRGFDVASRLSHPGIARLIEAGDHEGRLFVVEEFVEGETLAERLRRGSLPVDEALRILRKVGEILRYAHEAGVIHRDLSARNLMLTPSGRVVLVDFGLAVRPEGTTQPGSGSLLGTLPYLAPELIRGRAATARSDLYALGAIGYQMIAGTPPFVASQPEALIRQHLRERPVSLRKIRPEVDPRVDRLLLRLLAKQPEDRFARAEAFLVALDVATQQRVASPRPARSRAKRDPRAIRRLVVAPFTSDVEPGSEPERGVRIALGLAETIAAGLSALEGLTVLPATREQEEAAGSPAELVRRLGADAVLRAHLARGEDGSRLSWSILGRDGSILEGGRFGERSESLFVLEDALLGELIRALRRPRSSGRLAAPGVGAQSYAPFLEALGCLQRADGEGSVERAITLLERIRDEAGGGVGVHAALGRAYLRMFEIRREPEWKHRAEASCRIAISLDPLAPEAMVTMGRLCVSGGRASEGTAMLERALALDPGNVDAKVWLSRAHEMTGRFEDAQRVAAQACAEHPERWLVHDRNAVMDFRLGHFREAVEGWRRVLDLTPDNASALANLGAAYFEQGCLEQAEEAYREALGIARWPIALSGLGTVLFYRGRMDEAMHWFAEAVAAAPRDARHWGNLGDAQRWTAGEKERSFDSFDRAIELVRADLSTNPGDARSWFYLALYQAKREQHAEAQAALHRAQDLDGRSSTGRLRALVVHELGGRRTEAVACLHALAASGSLPFELRADPELTDLRASPEAEDLFRRPPERPHHREPRRARRWKSASRSN
jgi:tetratricopeptide (TPR) repeat protein